MVAQFSINSHLYCNAAGLLSPTGDEVVDANVENIEDFNRRPQQPGTNAGSRAVPKSYWAVIMSNRIQLRAILIPELHAHRPAERVGGYSQMRNSPGSGLRFVAMLM